MGVLYLTRHGETEWNTLWRLQGKKDSPLTQKGIDQALALGQRLKTIAIDRIVSSSSPRALSTARYIAMDRDIPIEPSDDLMEIGLGIWEGQTTEVLKRDYPEAFEAFWNKPSAYVPVTEGAETFATVQNRMWQKTQALMQAHPHETILLVTHGIALKTLIARLENRDLDSLFQDEMIHSASLSQVIYSPKGWTLSFKNNISHRAYDDNL